MGEFFGSIRIIRVIDAKMCGDGFEQRKYVKVEASVRKTAFRWWQHFNPFHREVREIVFQKNILMWRDIDTGLYVFTTVGMLFDKLFDEDEKELREFRNKAKDLNPFK